MALVLALKDYIAENVVQLLFFIFLGLDAWKGGRKYKKGQFLEAFALKTE